jgi:hypothetical protein
MTIFKEKPSSWDTVKSSAIVHHIDRVSNEIHDMISRADRVEMEKLDRKQLKNIAAELDTVRKRLAFILHGRY